jgi:hypothetical protein
MPDRDRTTDLVTSSESLSCELIYYMLCKLVLTKDTQDLSLS